MGAARPPAAAASNLATPPMPVHTTPATPEPPAPADSAPDPVAPAAPAPPASSLPVLFLLAALLTPLTHLLIGGASIARRALWLDELYSLTTSEEVPARIIELLAQYKPGYFDHPPLYFLLLHPWLAVGNSPLILRAPSLLLSSIALAVGAVALVRAGVSRVAALAWCVGIATVFEVYYQAEFVRSYSLVLLLATALTLAVLRIARHETRREAVLAGGIVAATTALLLYSTYMALLPCVGLGLVAVAWALYPASAGRTDRAAGLTLLFALAAAGIAFSPWLPTVIRLRQAEQGNDPPVVLSRLGEMWQCVRGIGGTWQGFLWLATGVAGLFCLGRERRRWLALLLALVIIPLLILGTTSPKSRIPATRYLFCGFPIAFLCAGIGWGLITQRLGARIPAGSLRGRLTPVIAVVAMLLAVPFQVPHLRTEFVRPRPDWWAVARILQNNARPEEFILTGGYLSGEGVVYHLDHPERFSFIHYITKFPPFVQACRDPNVVWYVNAVALPPAYEKVVNESFPYRVWYDGNGGTGWRILVAGKKPFPEATIRPAPAPAPAAASPASATPAAPVGAPNANP